MSRLRDFIDRGRIQDSYRAVFGTLDGERVLRHICEHSYVFKSTFVRGDPHETSLREGQRRLALSILRYVARDQVELTTKVREMAGDENSV